MFNRYTFKVYPKGLGKSVYRHIEICGSDKLSDLCESILISFDFDDDHLYEFCLDNKIYNNHRANPKDKPENFALIDEQGFKKGQSFILHYDFGDDWIFCIKVMEVKEVPSYSPSEETKAKGFVSQYGSEDWDDDWDDDWQ